MWILIAGLLLFFLPHLLREFGLRDVCISVLPSLGIYKLLYSLLSFAGIVLIISGKSVAPFIMLWQPIYELRYISHVLMIPVFILIMAGNLPMSYFRKRLRNPMLLGVCLWGLSHLWSNGDLASLLLFGSFTLWAGGKFIHKGFNTSAADHQASLKWDSAAVLSGLLIYLLVTIYHGQLFGVGLNLEF